MVEGSPESDGPSDILCLLAICTLQESNSFYRKAKKKKKWFVLIMFLFNMKSL